MLFLMALDCLAHDRGNRFPSLWRMENHPVPWMLSRCRVIRYDLVKDYLAPESV